MAPMKREPTGRQADLAATVSVPRLARRWHTSVRQVRKLLAQRQMDFVQIAGQIRVPKLEIERLERQPDFDLHRLPGPTVTKHAKISQ